MKMIVVIGGGHSEIGKSVLTASIGYILKEYGIKFYPIKFDGYLNLNTGTMCPYHKTPKIKILKEEVFILTDGTECDSDSGIYERFMDINLNGSSYITNGKVFSELLKNQYVDGDILQFKHLKEKYKELLKEAAENREVLLVEVGGTIGDNENIMFIQALFELSLKTPTLFILIAPMQFLHETTKNVLSSSQTKLIRSSIKALHYNGIHPEILVCRCRKLSDLKEEAINLIYSEAEIKKTNILKMPNVGDIYRMPFIMLNQDLDKLIFNALDLRPAKNPTYLLKKFLNAENTPNKEARILIIDKMESYGSFVSLLEALHHAAIDQKMKIKVIWLEEWEKNKAYFDGVILLNDFENIEEKESILKICREKDIPVLGISGGFYFMVEDYARNVLKLGERIVAHENLKIGEYETSLKNDTKIRDFYKEDTIHERHRHTETLMNFKNIENSNLIFSGFSDENIPDTFEMKNKRFYIGVAFHPEFVSKPLKPSPIICGFLQNLIQNHGSL